MFRKSCGTIDVIGGGTATISRVEGRRRHNLEGNNIQVQKMTQTQKPLHVSPVGVSPAHSGPAVLSAAPQVISEHSTSDAEPAPAKIPTFFPPGPIPPNIPPPPFLPPPPNVSTAPPLIPPPSEFSSSLLSLRRCFALMDPLCFSRLKDCPLLSLLLGFLLRPVALLLLSSPLWTGNKWTLT